MPPKGEADNDGAAVVTGAKSHRADLPHLIDETAGVTLRGEFQGSRLRRPTPLRPKLSPSEHLPPPFKPVTCTFVIHEKKRSPRLFSVRLIATPQKSSNYHKE